MYKQLTSKFKITKARAIVAGTVMAFAFMVASVNTVANPQSVNAEACDPVNIVYCGINGGGAAGYINSFQADYNSGANNGHHDLKAIYRWAGATDASVSSMNTNNTKVGTLYRNGQIKVDGKVVGHDAWVSARFSQGAGFQEITPGVWARKTTTSFAEASAPVIVHFNGNGAADFAVMLNCGNAIKFTPTPPEDDFEPAPNPPSSLVCKNLKAEQVGSTRRYNFIARGDANNTTISSYVFAFGDGEKRTVHTSKKFAALAHSYKKNGQTYTARVTVKSADGKSDTSKDCTVTIKTPTTPTVTECKPGIPVGSPECETPGTPPTPVTPVTPVSSSTELTKTGPASTAALFVLVTVAAAALHRYFVRRTN